MMEEMRKGDFNLGGEQSGHIIFLDYITTGDGMLSALQLVNILKATGKPLSVLASEMPTFPQRLVNIRVDLRIFRANCRYFARYICDI